MSLSSRVPHSSRGLMVRNTLLFCAAPYATHLAPEIDLFKPAEIEV